MPEFKLVVVMARKQDEDEDYIIHNPLNTVITTIHIYRANIHIVILDQIYTNISTLFAKL